MRIYQFMGAAISAGKGTVLAATEYRWYRREAAKINYRNAKRGLLPRPAEPKVRQRPIRQNTKFDRWF